MRRWIIRGSIALAVLLIALPVATLLYVTRTESGLQLVVKNVPKRVGRAQLDLGEVRGTLAHGVTISHLDIEHERVHLRLENIAGRVELLPLFARTISSSDLTVRDALIEVRRRKTPLPKSTPRFLPRGLNIAAERARVGHALLIAPNGNRIEATELRTSGVIRHRTMRFYEATAIWNEAHVSATGELRAADPMQLTAAGRLDLRLPEQPPLVIDAETDGNLDRLAITARFAQPFRADFEGEAVELTRAWRWFGKARVHYFDLQAWGAGDALGRITGNLDVSGNREGFAANGPLTPAGLEAGPFMASFQGAYSERVVQVRAVEFAHMASGARATGAGEIEVVEDGPRLDLKGTWRDFRWPLVGDDVSTRSASGEYTLKGVWPYALTASGELSPAELPSMQFSMQGALNKQSVAVQQAQLQALAGTAVLSGDVTWNPRETWSLAGTARGIDPGLIREELIGELDFGFSAMGDGFGDEGDFRVAVRDLGGRLRGVVARGSGTFARIGDRWELARVRVGLGRTSLSADGRIDDRLDLRFSVEAQDLSLLAPESRGQLRAIGSVRGTFDHPIVDVVASGGGIEHNGTSVESFTADIDFNAQRDALAHVALRATKLRARNRTIDRIRFDLDGAASSHEVRVGVRATGLDVAAQANGAFDSGVWSGKLASFTVRNEETLDLSLEQPVSLTLSRTLAQLDFICLRGTPARVCADADWSPSKWSATLTTTELPLSTLTAGLTPSLEYRGLVNVVARGFGGGADPWQGSFRADLIDAQILRRRPSGREDTITFGSGLVIANATRDSIDSQVTLDAREVGTINGELHARRTSGDWRQLPLRGELRAQTEELDILSLYIPQIDRAAGKLAANLALGGTLGTPLVSGLIRVNDGELDLYNVNLAMRQMALEARLLDNGLDFNGSARIGEGVARARGRVEWRDNQPFGRLELTGQRLQVANIPEAVVYAEPDLDFKIAGRSIQVTGAVKIPEARFVPVELTNAVRASSDEIIVSRGEPEARQHFTVTTGITLTLGDLVSIETEGLSGRLTGSITVRTGDEDITRGSGELRFEEGEYTYYGRRLEIERGRLVFTGGPVQNPGIDIRAVKAFPDVKAGVLVRGTLLQPRLTFFSEPPLPQSQIVSLILAGGSLQSVQDQAPGTRRDSAGSELLAQGSAILAQQLGSKIGLEDVSIESNLANETSLVLGKYLSPRFYVSYGISLTEALNTLKLRYSLSDHWTIRSEVGEEQGADLVYTIEK